MRRLVRWCIMWRAKSALRFATVGLAAGGLWGALGGCAAREEPATFNVAQGEYERAFVATRAVLREVNFEIERVDAARGVITTRARSDAGVFTPWTGYQLDAASAVEGSLNQQRRRVRVTFVPIADQATYEGGGGDQDRIGSQLDEVASRGPWTAYVDVGVTRMQTSGLRPPPRTVLLSSVSVDPIAQAQGIATIYEVPVSQDTAMAAALTRRIRKRLGLEHVATTQPAPASSSAQPPISQPATSEPIHAERATLMEEPVGLIPTPTRPAPVQTEAPSDLDPMLVPVPPQR